MPYTRMYATARLFLTALVAAVPVFSTAADFLPPKLHRVQGYEGPARPRSEVAILFAMDGRPHFESATLCAIDGISLEQDGVCASIAYVLPGTHRLQLRYRSHLQTGTGELEVSVAANRLYQISFSSLRVDYAAQISVIPMYEGAKLSWRNIAPGLAAGSPRIDEEVPYEPNSERGGPVEEKVVSDADRPTLDRLLDCAGKFATDMELRKFDQRGYESQYAAVGAFVRGARSYTAEEDAMSGMVRARRKAMRAYAAAFAMPVIASEESKQARSQLAEDLKACDDFYEAHRSEFSRAQ